MYKGKDIIFPKDPRGTLPKRGSLRGLLGEGLKRMREDGNDGGKKKKMMSPLKNKIKFYITITALLITSKYTSK